MKYYAIFQNGDVRFLGSFEQRSEAVLRASEWGLHFTIFNHAELVDIRDSINFQMIGAA